ncbi:MAG: class I SAM-dependent methyltransferase [Burkholderiales bacterium]|nr:class I SAM-dependent methyltransferase [Anaerolineae bacterium]
MFIYKLLKERLSPQQRQAVRKLFRRIVSPIPNQSLNVLAYKYGTDKRYHGYIPHYERYFEPLRKRALNVLEIGVGGYEDPYQGGESLRMWQEYFPCAMIYGIDIENKCPQDDKRIKTFRGSQNDPNFLEWVAAQIGRIDLIIDDGSHISEHIITSFKTLFPHLVSGGIYVIEDLYYAYCPAYGGNDEDLNEPRTSIAMLKSTIDGLHHKYIPNRPSDCFDQSIAAVHCYPKIAYIFKVNN